ncbi:MAG: phage holin family protein [Oscillochloridaceae bacterium]|nr:phage holin family protein [Chloroflexaceae bacterium]MDW8389053.1 phage holin family protein [Oscillochloridaceae bacterium]
MQLLLRWLLTAVALAITAWIVPGITVEGQTGIFAVLVMAVVFGFVNAFIRPLLKLLSCPLIILTLGLFTLVINAISFSLSSWIAQNVFGAKFIVDGFWPAFWGAIVVSIVSFLLSLLLPDKD